jgi:hypothetical protein
MSFSLLNAPTCCDADAFFPFNLRIFQDGHTPAAEAASTEGQQHERKKERKKETERKKD